MNVEYTNVSRLIDRVRACARRASEVMNEMHALEAESVRVGGEVRLSPYFFVLDPVTGLPTATLRTDLGFTLTELNFALSAFKILSAGADNGVPGMAAQIDAQWASIDKIKV